MQKPLHENLENFLPYLKSELAAKGILSASLKTIFLNYIDQITKENRFVSHTNTTDRQIVYIERGDDALLLRFKYFVENNEYLEVELIITDTHVKLVYAESPELHLLYDDETPICLDAGQLIKCTNDYGTSLATLISALFHCLLSDDPQKNIQDVLNQTNLFDKVSDENAELNKGSHDFDNRQNQANIWVF